MKAKKKVAKVKQVATRPTTLPKPTRRPTAKKKTATKTTKTAAATKVAKRKVVRRKAAVKLPAILLEGDFPVTPPISGPGEKYALGPTPPVQEFVGEAAELPEAYGTKRLFLTARDPHWLYANWDFTREQQARYNRLSADGHLILRIYFAPPAGGLALEVHAHPESRHWFAHVPRAGTKYSAEVGYYNQRRKWTSLASSGATLTPPETISDETGVEFATIPGEVPFEQLLALVKTVVQTNLPLAQAVEELRREGHPDLPAVKGPPIGDWTPAQEAALAEVVSLDQVRRVWIGSLEITELVRRQLGREISSQGVAQLSGPTSPASAVGAVTSVASPFGGEQPRGKGFWFNVNAELVIYGATERDASVSIGGRKIKLRHDGSFSYRFALPDGQYELPVVAVSADKTDGRAAQLYFIRGTEYLGDVGASPQDPELKTPEPENL
jgi:hypothetical protein